MSLERANTLFDGLVVAQLARHGERADAERRMLPSVNGGPGGEGMTTDGGRSILARGYAVRPQPLPFGPRPRKQAALSR